MRRMQRLTGAGKLQQRLQQIGHLIHRDAYLLIEFLPLAVIELAFCEELRVGYDRGQRMA